MSHKGRDSKTARSSVLTPSRPFTLNLGHSFDDPARRLPWHAVLIVMAMAVLAYVAMCACGALAVL